MSRRVTNSTKMKNKDLVLAAAQSAGIDCSVSGEHLVHFQSGDLRGASLDINTGVITGDSDLHSKDTLGLLKKHYAEAEIRKNYMLHGHTIEERQVMADGRIRLVCSGNIA